MYRYTPNKQLLDELKKIKKSLYAHDKIWEFAGRYFKTYSEKATFIHEWPQVELYSKVRLHKIPVRGYLFPLKLFDEVTIADTDAKLS